MVTPGVNVLRLIKKATVIERYFLGQVAIRIGKLEFLSQLLTQKFVIDVKRAEPTVRLDKGASPLLSGIEQTMQLSITVGSYKIENVSTIVSIYIIIIYPRLHSTRLYYILKY